MSSLQNKSVCFLISSPLPDAPHEDNALDFILAASNLTDNITVIFLSLGNERISRYLKPLEGFEIKAIYSDNPGINPISLINPEKVNHYVTYCQHVFSF